MTTSQSDKYFLCTSVGIQPKQFFPKVFRVLNHRKLLARCNETPLKGQKKKTNIDDTITAQ